MAKRRAARIGRQAARDAPPDAIRDMLGELDQDMRSQGAGKDEKPQTPRSEDSRPVKRRRIGVRGRRTSTNADESAVHKAGPGQTTAHEGTGRVMKDRARPGQVIEQNNKSGGSTEHDGAGEGNGHNHGAGRSPEQGAGPGLTSLELHGTDFNPDDAGRHFEHDESDMNVQRLQNNELNSDGAGRPSRRSFKHHDGPGSTPLEPQSSESNHDGVRGLVKHRRELSPPELQSIEFNPYGAGEEKPESSPELQGIEFNPESSDDEFEDVVTGVDIDQDAGKVNFDLTLNETTNTPKRRRPVLDKKLIMQTHQLHLLCLLSHVSLRNHWCNDDRVHKTLRRLVPRKARQDMMDTDGDQFARDQKLRNGLKQTMATFKEKFKVTARGLVRAWWEGSPNLEGLDLITSIDDFRTAANELAGSRDIGAQLFCAMLRSLGLDVRLVCSLQPLPMNGSVRPKAPVAPESRITYDDNEEVEEKVEMNESSRTSIHRRLYGDPVHRLQVPAQPNPTRPSRRESPHPVFWVEVFSPAYQRWICVDVLVTNTLSQPAKLEPALKDIRNAMSYVMAIEEDGSMKDVTRRYASQFNAKTRKTRLAWWDGVVRCYKPSRLRDEIEDAEMLRRSEREGMPRSVEDFKGHPVYVLERHLRQNEVIHPRREVGRIGVGPVFRRQDVQHVKTADAWYRVGREVRIGQQPLKRKDAGMYAMFQTDLYRAPPVKYGRVPRNAYGNLDVYVPSMIPPGGVHFLHPDTREAARLLGLDYVDAVTGFEFRGRQGSAVVRGAVVGAEYKDAILEVLHGMASEKEEARARVVEREVLRLWRRFLVGLKINERVAGYANDVESEGGSDDGRKNGNDDGKKVENESEDEGEIKDELEDHAERQGGFEPVKTSGDTVGRRAVEQVLKSARGVPLDWQDFVVIDGPPLDQPKEPKDKSRKRVGQSKDVGEADKSFDDAGGFFHDSALSEDVPEGGLSHEPADIDELFEERSAEEEAVGGEVKSFDAKAESAAGGGDDESEVKSLDAKFESGAGAEAIESGAKIPDAMAESGARAEDVESDRGSLLSEDPEDADAEPDWLEQI